MLLCSHAQARVAHVCVVIIDNADVFVVVVVGGVVVLVWVVVLILPHSPPHPIPSSLHALSSLSFRLFPC